MTGRRWWMAGAVTLALGICLALATMRMRKPAINEATSERSIQILTELDPTEVIAISEVLLDDYDHAPNLVKAIIEAGARVLVLTPKPVLDSDRDTWLAHLNMPNELMQNIAPVPVVHDSIWVRDFNPIPVRLQPAVYDRYFLGDFRFRSETSTEDAASYQLALYLNLNLFHTPLVMEGGNFVSNGSRCILSNDVKPEKATDGLRIQDTLRQYLGCSEVYLIGDSPHDHADMYTKFISRDTVLVNKLVLNDSMSGILSPKDLELSRKYQAQLEKIATQLSRDFSVVRLPMPPIVNGIFRTYANSLLVNSTAIVPSYRIDMISDLPFGETQDIEEQEREVAEIYLKAGFNPIFINSDYLIARGGAVHCTTSQLPANRLSVAKM